MPTDVSEEHITSICKVEYTEQALHSRRQSFSTEELLARPVLYELRLIKGKQAITFPVTS
jgi:hypothetical protein